MDFPAIIPQLQRRSRAVIVGFTITVLSVVTALIAADLWWEYDRALERAERRAVNLAFVLSKYIQGSFAAADMSLRQLAVHGGRVGGADAPPGAWDPILASARAAMASSAATGSISVADRQGTIRHSTQPDIVGQSRREQYIFRSLSVSGSDDLVIDAPFIVSSPATSSTRFILPIGRRLTDANGAFDGVVVTTFAPDAHREFFRTVDVGVEGVISVVHPDGVLIFREPSPTDPIGRTAADDPILRASQSGAPTGLHVGPLIAGGPAYISAYETLNEPPLIVAVSLSRAEALSEWRAHLRTALFSLGALTATLSALALLLFRQIGARMKVEQELGELQRDESIRLREANERLEAALDREQRARQESEAAGRLKDEFLMTLSHELRTPLTAIYGWVRMLATGIVPTEERARALATVERNALAQTRLIDDLLDVSRAISGKLRLEARAVNVAEIVRAAVETLTPAVEAKHIRLETAVDRHAGVILADPDRVQQIVWNLLSNAIKFTPEGGTVGIEARRVDSAIELVVRDSGVGIDPEFVPYVFDRFRQGEAGTRRRYGGLGLGLAIVRHLVELHGGTVIAESEGEGKGATFRVVLPLRPAQADGNPESSRAAAASRSEAARLTGLRVLVVDDEPDARELFASIIRAAGAHVTTASSAAEAVQQITREVPQIVVSDIEMPTQDGYQLLAAIRRQFTGRTSMRPLVVAVTCYARAVDRRRALDAGFDSYLAKPVEPTELVATLASLASRHGSLTTPVAP